MDDKEAFLSGLQIIYNTFVFLWGENDFFHDRIFNVCLLMVTASCGNTKMGRWFDTYRQRNTGYIMEFIKDMFKNAYLCQGVL